VDLSSTGLQRLSRRTGEYRHWLRAKFFGRLRLSVRYDSRSHLIVYAWVNDERTLRQE
jgi:hypothetical protein